MSENEPEKDRSMLYIALVAVAAVSVLLAVKSSEADKFAPIKQQLNEETRLLNVRVLSNYS